LLRIPADVRGDDVNQMFRIFQHDRKDEAVDERILRRDVESELPRARFELRNRGPRLHRGRLQALVHEPLAHDDVGFPEDLVDIPTRQDPLERHIVRRVAVERCPPASSRFRRQ